MKKLVVLIIMIMILGSFAVHAQELPWSERLTTENGLIPEESGSDDNNDDDSSGDGSGDDDSSSSSESGDVTTWILDFQRGYRTPNYGSEYDRFSRGSQGMTILSSEAWTRIGPAARRIPSMSAEEILAVYEQIPPETLAEINQFFGEGVGPQQATQQFLITQLLQEQNELLANFVEGWRGDGEDWPTASEVGWDQDFLSRFEIDVDDLPEGTQVAIALDTAGAPQLIEILDENGEGTGSFAPQFQLLDENGDPVTDGDGNPVVLTLTDEVTGEVQSFLEGRANAAYFRSKFNLQTGLRAAAALNSLVGIDWQEWRNEMAFVFSSDVWTAVFDPAEGICRAEWRFVEGVRGSSPATVEVDGASNVVGRGAAGQAVSIVHVEGIRMTIDAINASTGIPYKKYVYRFTPKVVHPSVGAGGVFANAQRPTYKFSFVLIDDKGEEFSVFENPIYLQDGGTWSRTGSGAIVGESTRNWVNACIRFTDSGEQPETGRIVWPNDYNNRIVREFCRSVQEQTVSTSTSGSRASGSSGSSESGEEDGGFSDGQNQNFNLGG